MGYPTTPYDYKELKKKRTTNTASYLESLQGDELTVTESFRWLTDDFKTQDAGKDSIKIKGVALRSDVTSRNGRKYIDEELQFAARTFVGKPLTLNHGDPSDKANIIGHIDWCQYEDRCLEYLATVKKQPYVDLIREGSTKIRGVSIEAEYLRNPEQPYGIVGKALSIVLAPEETGVPNTTIELVETANTVHRLFETVLTSHGIKYPEQGEDVKKHILGEPFAGYKDFKDCVSKNQDKEDPEAYCASIEQKAKEADDSTAPRESPVPICDADQVWNPTTGKCEPIADVAAKLDEISKQVTKEQLTKIYETILSFADRNVEFMKETAKPNPELLEAYQQAAESFNSLQTAINSLLTTHQNTIKETTQLKERLETIETQQDNLEHKIKGSFKQNHIRETKEETEDSADDTPYKQ